MNVLIVEDEYLARAELSHLIKKHEKVKAVFEAESIEEAFKALLSNQVGIVFIDIHLTDESGMTLAEQIKKMENPPIVIFATAYDHYAVEAFEKNARDYILKPFEEKRVLQALNRAFDSIEEMSESPAKEKVLEHASIEKIPVQTEDRIYMFSRQDLLLIEAIQGKTAVYTKDNKLETRETLQSWQEKLEPYSFMRIHRSYVVNLKAITEVEPWFNHTYQLTLNNALTVPVSRSYINNFRERFGL
ncbi:MAG: LytTR family transcriptional regulator DNA-binding domain-containing protein [Alkalibacterium sp.]|uniref:LytR/AlgR family response regulator transcription factor n=1 Tax=Alkalibacterium sp. TaxID=1872447 RepID=UPI003970C050